MLDRLHRTFLLLWCVWVVLTCLAMPAFGKSDGTCATKAAVIDETYRQVANAIVTDLAGPQEEIFLQNLSRIEAQDFIGKDIVLFRFPGKGSTTVSVFVGDCYSQHLNIPNLFIQILLSLPKEHEA